VNGRFLKRLASIVLACSLVASLSIPAHANLNTIDYSSDANFHYDLKALEFTSNVVRPRLLPSISVPENTVNLVKSPRMILDSSGDGVVDDFTSATGGVTAAYSFEHGKQRVTISAGGPGTAVVYQRVALAAGERISVSADGEIADLVKARGILQVKWRDASNYIGSPVLKGFTASGRWKSEDAALVAPAGTVQAEVQVGLEATAGGAGAKAWISNLQVEKK